MHACCAFYLYNYKKGSLCHRINEMCKHKHGLSLLSLNLTHTNEFTRKRKYTVISVFGYDKLFLIKNKYAPNNFLMRRYFTSRECIDNMMQCGEVFCCRFVAAVEYIDDSRPEILSVTDRRNVMINKDFLHHVQRFVQFVQFALKRRLDDYPVKSHTLFSIFLQLECALVFFAFRMTFLWYFASFHTSDRSNYTLSKNSMVFFQ